MCHPVILAVRPRGKAVIRRLFLEQKQGKGTYMCPICKELEREFSYTGGIKIIGSKMLTSSGGFGSISINDFW